MQYKNFYNFLCTVIDDHAHDEDDDFEDDDINLNEDQECSF